MCTSSFQRFSIHQRKCPPQHLTNIRKLQQQSKMRAKQDQALKNAEVKSSQKKQGSEKENRKCIEEVTGKGSRLLRERAGPDMTTKVCKKNIESEIEGVQRGVPTMSLMYKNKIYLLQVTLR